MTWWVSSPEEAAVPLRVISSSPKCPLTGAKRPVLVSVCLLYKPTIQIAIKVLCDTDSAWCSAEVEVKKINKIITNVGSVARCFKHQWRWRHSVRFKGPDNKRELSRITQKLLFTERNTFYSRCVTSESNDALVSSWGARGVSLTLTRTCSVSCPPAANHTSASRAQTARSRVIDDRPETITIIAFLCSYQTLVPLNNIELVEKSSWFIATPK